MLDPTDPRYVTGSPEDQKRARADWHRQRYIAQVMGSDLEIPRADIAPLRFGVVEDTRTGTFYRRRRDQLPDLDYTSATAYYVDAAGSPVLLERPSTGPTNRSELEAQQAEREARRNAPKPPPRGMR